VSVTKWSQKTNSSGRTMMNTKRQIAVNPFVTLLRSFSAGIAAMCVSGCLVPVQVTADSNTKVGEPHPTHYKTINVKGLDIFCREAGPADAATLNLNIRNMKTNDSSPKVETQMYETENDLPKAARAELNRLINQRLADVVDLQMQLKQAHWNVKGPHFIGLHELFDQVAEEVGTYVDMVAERIVQLGGIAEGTVRAAAARSLLEEYPLAIGDGQAHLAAVAKALSTFGREARTTINEVDSLKDADTSDLFTEISRGIDKWLWFVEAHMQASK